MACSECISSYGLICPECSFTAQGILVNKVSHEKTRSWVLEVNAMRTLRIAVSDELSSVKNYFVEKGHTVVPVRRDTMEDVDMVVLSGLKKDFAGIQDMQLDVPVLEARGLAPEELIAEVERRARLM